MIRIRYFLFVLVTIYIVSCQQKEKPVKDKDTNVVNSIVENSVDRDLDAIIQDGVLRALVVYSSTSYFLYKGQPMGFEYELLQQLADHLNLKLEIIVSDNLDNQFEVLNISPSKYSFRKNQTTTETCHGAQ